MRKYIIFILPIFGLLSVELFMPLNTFTHRPWEALLFKSNKTMFFYPNQQLDHQSVGDLCHHTQFAIEKNENWITDKLGFRNDTFIKKADVLLIGDSFMVGSSIPQDSTMTNLLKEKLNNPTYNIAPAGFTDFIDLLKQGVIKKPKIIIYSCVESSIPSPIKISKETRFTEDVSSFSVFKDKVKRLYSLKYINSRVTGKHGKGVQGVIASRMFFLHGKEQNYHYDKIMNIAKTIQSYKDYCDAIGVDFIFLPVPNKETVYFDKVPLKSQPVFLFTLDSVLREKKIKTINTLELFNNYRTSNSNIIYHLDDSHWNARGVDLVTEKIAKFISINTQ
jgi:hypothetical protein